MRFPTRLSQGSGVLARAVGRPVTCARGTRVTCARALAVTCARVRARNHGRATLWATCRQNADLSLVPAYRLYSVAGSEDEVFVVSKVVPLPSLPLPPVQPIPVDVVSMHWRHPMLGEPRLCSVEEKDLSFSNVSNFGTWTASSLSVYRRVCVGSNPPLQPAPCAPPGSWGCGLRVGVVSFQGFFRVVQDTCMCLGLQIFGETGLRV